MQLVTFIFAAYVIIGLRRKIFMKKPFNIIFTVAVMAPLLAAGVVAAHGGESHESHKTEAVNVESQLEAMKARREAAKATLQQRLEERKARLQVQLTAARQQRLLERCKPAQARIINLGERINGNVPKRYQAYENLTNRLESLITRLEVHNVDTAKLQSQKAELEQKISAFKSSLEAYQQELADAGTLDCTADTAAFQASLEAARNTRQDLQQDAADIRTYVTETIKSELAAIRQQLAAQASTEGDN
jgi:chromosome segregation ATPase